MHAHIVHTSSAYMRALYSSLDITNLACTHGLHACEMKNGLCGALAACVFCQVSIELYRTLENLGKILVNDICFTKFPPTRILHSMVLTYSISLHINS